MARITLALSGTLAALIAQPALAASKNPFSGEFYSLSNTDFIVLVAFVAFIAVLVHFKVPSVLAKMLDQRSAGIQSELDEARALREEAQTLLASYERKQKDVQDQADRIIAHAKADAEIAAEQAKADLGTAIERRLAAAEDRITSAQASAVKDVRDQAATIAIAAARDVIATQMSASNADKLIDEAISEVDTKLH